MTHRADSAPLTTRSAPPTTRRWRRRPPTVLAGALTAVVALIPLACGDDTATSGEPFGTPNGPRWGPDSGKALNAPDAPVISEPKGPAPDSLVSTDFTIGTGAELTKGNAASVDYIGARYSDGKVFDASFGRAPLPLTVGVGQVIPGWDQGLIGMRVGGRRQLVIPADLAYGAQAPPDIGADQPLIFIVDLHWTGTKPVVEPSGPTPTLGISDLIDGTSDRSVAVGDTITVHYVGIDAATGVEFDASWNRQKPITTGIGTGGVIEGWDQGLIGMRVGGRRRLVIPPELAYGAAGRPPAIAANATLVFEIDLLALS